MQETNRVVSSSPIHDNLSTTSTTVIRTDESTANHSIDLVRWGLSLPGCLGLLLP